MDTYSEALDAFLKRDGNSEAALAEKADCTQASINRYRNGKRFPDRDRAKRIHDASDGEVALGLWQSEFLRRSGVDLSDASSAAA